MRHIFTILISLMFAQAALANPYWDPNKVPKDSSYASSHMKLADHRTLKKVTADNGIDVLRIQVDWREGEQFIVSRVVTESSGTPALIARSVNQPKWGSYRGVLKDSQGKPLYYDAVGTGSEYRHLTRAMTFRFPVPKSDVTFELYAEDPQSGVMTKVVSKLIHMKEMPPHALPIPGTEIRELALATKTPSLRVNIYAEGYAQKDMDLFWQHAQKTVRALQNEKFPGVEYMSFYAVFHASNTALGKAKDLGMPIPERDSFLGLYYPYWEGFGRWYNVVYPTREDKMRYGLAAAPYDYPIILINNAEYWGVGNYMAFTAIPAASSSYFNYLLMHEFGHFFGLNEEYQGGGRTELEFSPGIDEPWSQNITFLHDTRHENLKWNAFVDKKTPLPTPWSQWSDNPRKYGAYEGGYADSGTEKNVSHIPGLNCTMESRKNFCDVCKHGIEDVVHFGIGQ